MPLVLSLQHMAQILKEATTHFPSECCGLGLARMNQPDQLIQVISCENVQDEFHQKDPSTYLRTSLHGYLLDPKALLKIHKQVREQGLLIRLIYHSHINALDVFSEEDQRQAMFEDAPLYPTASYLVVSVQNKKPVSSTLYRWNPGHQMFSPETLRVLETSL